MGGRKIANQSNSSPEEILMAKKQLRRAIITAVFLVIGLQIAWIIAISQSAIREVNQPKSEFEEIHLFEVFTKIFWITLMTKLYLEESYEITS